MKGSNHRFMLRGMGDHVLRTVIMILVNFTSLTLKSLERVLWRLNVTLNTVNNISDQWTFLFFFSFSSKIKEGNKKQKSMSMKLLKFPT